VKRRAIDIALDLLARPFLVREVQRSPLPGGVREVIWLATSSEPELAAASKTRGRDPKVLRQAAIFYLQQALLYPGADNYRVLGLSPGATVKDIRDHKRLLLKWLHPDRNPSSWEQLLFQRVATAASDLEQGLARHPSSHTISNYQQRNLRRGSRRCMNAARKRPEDKFRNYLRRAAIAGIVFVIGASAWRLMFGEPGPMTLGWLAW
jgi:hypothetical protein